VIHEPLLGLKSSTTVAKRRGSNSKCYHFIPFSKGEFGTAKSTFNELLWKIHDNCQKEHRCSTILLMKVHF